MGTDAVTNDIQTRMKNQEWEYRMQEPQQGQMGKEED